MEKIQADIEASFPGHKDAVYTLLDGGDETFISAGGDGMVVRWQLRELGKGGDLLARLPAAIYALCYGKDTSILYAGTRNGVLYALDLEAKQLKVQATLAGDIFGLLYHTEKDTLAAICADGHLYYLKPDSLEIITHIQPTQANGRCLALSPDGTLLATGWSDSMIRLYAWDQGSPVQEWAANDPSVFCLAWTPDGSLLLSGGRDAKLKVWDTAHQFTGHADLPAHMYTINKILFSPDGKRFATGSRDKTVKIWDTDTLTLRKVLDRSKYPGAHTHSVNALLWMGNDLLLSGGDDRKILSWRMENP